MKKLNFAMFLLAGVMMCSCDPSSLTGGDDDGGNGGKDGKDEIEAQSLSGTMSENTTLKDLGLPIDYIIDGCLYLNGNAMLTIEPGVCIAFTGSDGEIEVGENCGINWAGTEEKPIVLRGPINNNNPGSWKYVDLYSKRSDNKLEYVRFLNGGDENYAPLCINGSAKVSIKHCSFEGSLGYGIWSYGAITAFENNTIKDVQKDAMYINVDDNTLGKSSFGMGNVYKDNKRNRIFLDNWYLTQGEFTFTNQGIPYFLNSGLGLTGDFTVNIEPGVNIIVGEGQQIDIEEKAKFYAKGTEEAPILFCGVDGEPGSWDFLDVYTTKACELEYVILDGGGQDGYYGGLVLNNSKVALSMKNVVIRNSDGFGFCLEGLEGEWQYSEEAGEEVLVYFKPEKLSYENVTFDNCKKGNIGIGDEAYETFPW